MARRKTHKEFVQQALKIHGQKYSYTLFDYKRMHNKEKIKCRKCKEVFIQVLNNHINGKQCGCPNCGGTKKIANKREFVKRAVARHGRKYSYVNTTYDSNQNNKQLVKIKCRKHGVFEVEAGAHISARGVGCARCYSIAWAEALEKRTKACL